MSAYVCNPAHIKELAAFAASGSICPGSLNVPAHSPRYYGGKDMSGHTHEDVATYYANVLWDENIRSVMTRYADSYQDGQELPGPIDRPKQLKVTRRNLMNRRVKDPVHLLKMCDCLEYQSCETEDYRQTTAFGLLDAIRGAAISRLPGYDQAPWELAYSKDGH